MGYVHDILLDLDYGREAFAAAVADIRTLFNRTELPIAGPTGRPGSRPILNDDIIWFSDVNRFCICDREDPEYFGPENCPFPDCHPPPFVDGVGQPFVMDLSPEQPFGVSLIEDRYWFDCKTGLRDYDVAVMLAMIPLKHHLGDQVEMRSKGTWGMWKYGDVLYELVFGWRVVSAVDVYERVFPERAPVQNILSREGGY